jgi:dTDP-4-dehydrorhamnose reductase
MKNVLITGASGMLGSNICFSLGKNFNVTGTYFSNKPNINNVHMIKMDIRNKKRCQKVIKTIDLDIVIHCAAITDMDLCETNQILAYDVNTFGTENILDSINKDCHFIYISTDNVYSNGNRFNKEKAKKSPTNVYGDSKLKAEKVILNSKRKYTILRTNIFGWHLLNKDAGLLNFIYNNLKNKNKITLFKDVFFTPISIPLFVDGLQRIIDNEIIGTFNFGGKERISKLAFGLKIADVFGLDKNSVIPISLDEKFFIAKRPKEMSMDSANIAKYIKVPNRIVDQIIELGFPN